MKRLCTACGDAFESHNGRRTCSHACAMQRQALGGGHAQTSENLAQGRVQYPYPRAPRRPTGDGRSVMTERGLTVDDPAALAAQGVVMVDCWGGKWESL